MCPQHLARCCCYLYSVLFTGARKMFFKRKKRMKSHGYYRCCGIQRAPTLKPRESREREKRAARKMGSEMLSTFSWRRKNCWGSLISPQELFPFFFFLYLLGYLFALQPDHRAYDNSRFLFFPSLFRFSFFYLRHLFLNFLNRSDKPEQSVDWYVVQSSR